MCLGPFFMESEIYEDILTGVGDMDTVVMYGGTFGVDDGIRRGGPYPVR